MLRPLWSRCPLGDPSLLPPCPHSSCLRTPWEEKQERPHVGFSLPTTIQAPCSLRGSVQGGPGSVSFFPGSAAPSSWGCGEKGPDGAVNPIWATPWPSELCLQLQEGQSQKRSQAERKLVRRQTPEAKGVAGRGPIQSDTCMFASACRVRRRPQQACMGVVTGESWAFGARSQLAPPLLTQHILVNEENVPCWPLCCGA